MSPPLVARHVVDFTSVIAEWHRIKVSIGPLGDVNILTLKQQPGYGQTPDGDWSYVKSFVDLPKNFRIYHQVKDGWSFVDVAETREIISYAQPLAQDKWLVVRSRSADDADANGYIYSSEGRLLSTMPLGDGIQDVQTTPSGQIWVSYFDEGVFGNTTFGTAGLANFDAKGVQHFDFNAAHEWMITDCYALNVVSDAEVWLCPYQNFPLVKLKNRKISHRWNNNPVHGSHAFAVWKDRALFTGGYNQRDKLFVVHLYQSTGKELAKEEHQAVSEDGKTIKFTRAFGRGARLYLMNENSLYSLDLQVT